MKNKFLKEKMIAEVLYQRKRQILLNKTENGDMTLEKLSPIMVLLKKETGMIFSEKAIKEAAGMKEDELLAIVETVIETWKKERGANFNMQAMYRNFPASVMEMSDYELILNAIHGYLADLLDIVFETGGSIRNSISFDGEKKERAALPENEIKADTLDAGSMDSYWMLVRDLIGGKATLSEPERKIVTDAVLSVCKAKELNKVMPEAIPQKDNLVFVVKLFLENELSTEAFPLKNATDAMRLAREINHIEDIKNQKYKFSNSEKVFLYSIMEQDTYLSDNIKGREKEFKALIRGLNGLKNAEKRFPNTSAVFAKVKANQALDVSYRGRIQLLYNEGNKVEAAAMLKTTPGLFAQWIDRLLSGENKKDGMKILSMFQEVMEKVPTRTLFTLKHHMETRKDGECLKTVIPPKGSGALIYTKNNLPIEDSIKESLLASIVETITVQVKGREPMGKVYISPEYKNIPIPHDTKQESGGMRPITRGTRFKIDESVKVIRSFIYWVGQDLDLSASMLDENFEEVERISFTRLKNDCGCHSGDITNAPQGASEYIDLNLDAIRKNYPNGRYICFQVHVFAGKSFKNTEDCMFGYMERSEVNSGEIYEPKTVVHAFDLDKDSYFCIPMILDVAEREMVWAELSINNYETFDGILRIGSCVENNRRNSSAAVMHMIQHTYPSMLTVIEANVKTRGELVDDPAEADVVYGVEPISDEMREAMCLKKDAVYYDMFARETWGDML